MRKQNELNDGKCLGFYHFIHFVCYCRNRKEMEKNRKLDDEPS